MKYIVSICSAIIWGSGQFINKQKIKGFVFFIIQALMVGVDLMTGTLNVLVGKSPAQFRYCGFFIKGIWGLITLGTIPRTDTKVKVYDHSIMLMISGIIALAVLLILIAIWIWNIKDAYDTRVKIEKNEFVSDQNYFKNLWDKSFEYIVITPGMLLVLFVSVIPIVFSFLVVFTNYNANFIPPKKLIEWTGFQTFVDIVKIPIWSSTFVSIFIWTVCWAFIAAFSTYFLGMFQAVILNSKLVKFKKLWRGILILPWAIPGFVSILVFRGLLNKDGAVNAMLLSSGFIEKAIPFLSNANWAKLTVILVNLWLGFPYFMALISGILTTVSPELYEASSLDGANGFQQFRHITFPVIFSATSPLLLFSITHNFNNFGLIYFLTEGGPANPKYQMAGSTDILITWIFKLTLDQRMYNYAAAMSIFIFVIIATVSTVNLMRTRSFKED